MAGTDPPDLLRRAYIDARYSRSYSITEEELGSLMRRVRELAVRIRRACIARLGTLCGPEAVRGDLPDVPALDDPLLAEAPPPGDAAALLGWKLDLLAHGEAAGRREGEAAGRRTGKAEGKAEAILAVLSARGLIVEEGLRQRVLGCWDETTLSRWLSRAATASTAEEALDTAPGMAADLAPARK